MTACYEIEIDITACGGFLPPENWLRDRGWRTCSKGLNNDFQFVGSRSKMVGSNAWGREFYRYRFSDPRKARLFMLVWSGNRV